MIYDMIEVTAIPAPSGMEAARAAWLAAKLSAFGLAVEAPDEAGNVRAIVGDRSKPPVIVAAHLDTVFPADTDLTVRRDGGRIYAPGIADNGRGIAALVSLAAALRPAAAHRPSTPLRPAAAHSVDTLHPIMLVGTVGEEGAGNLRGVKHLFDPRHGLHECKAFIAVDGAGINRIVHRAIASRRLRVSVAGPGGHSWADRGTANPVHALADGIARAQRCATGPAGTFSVGIIEGGTGVNVIPSAATAAIDIRSEDQSEVMRVEACVRASFESALSQANATRKAGTSPLCLAIEVTGDRPGGVTPANSRLVQLAMDATRHAGGEPELTASSTDANVPMSLGIPAIAIGAGGHAGGMHTLDEWYSDEGGPAGIRRLLHLTLALAGGATAVQP